MNFSTGDFVVLVACECLGEGAFSGAIGPHDGVNFTFGYCKGEVFEDFFFADADVEIFDFEGAHWKMMIGEC